MEQKNVMKRKQTIWGMIIMAALAAVTFYLLLKDQSISKIHAALRGANLWYIGAGFIMMLVFIWSEAVVIRILMKSFGQKVGRIRAVAYSFVGFYFSSITPSATGGQPMQAYYMGRDGIKLAHSSFVLLVITSCYQLVVLFYGTIMFLLHMSFVAAQPAIIKWLLGLGILVNGGAAVFLLLVIFDERLARVLIMKGIALCSKLHLIKNREAMERKAISSIMEYSKGGIYLKEHRRVAVTSFLLTVVQLTALYSVPYFVCLALGISTLRYDQILALQAILSLCVTAVPLPGSVGASEGSFLSLYRNLIPSTALLPVMVLSRGVSFYSFLLLSGFIVAILHFKPLNYET